ncbi:MAG: AI-2E family transporter [candidate division WOR-3 bacterium]
MTWRVIGWVATLVATLLFLYWVRNALPPFVIGGVIALLLNPTVERLCEKRNLSRSRAILNVFFAFLLITLALGTLLVPPFYAQAQMLVKAFSPQDGTVLKSVQQAGNRIQVRIARELQKREDWVRKNEKLLAQMNLPTEPKALAQALTKPIAERLTRVTTDWTSHLLQSVVNLFLGLLSKLLWIILIPFTAYLFMLDMDHFHRAFLFLFPPAQRPAIQRLLDEIGSVFLRYIRGLITVALLYGSSCCMVFWLLGVPNPLLLGSIAGVLYLVPYIGAALTALLSGGFTYLFEPAHPFLFLFTPATSWHTVLVVLSGFALNMVFDMLITPRVLGGAVGLRPLASLFAILVGAQVFGIWGMLLAVPLATALKIIIERLLHFFYGEAEFLEKPVAPTPIETDLPEAEEISVSEHEGSAEEQ